MSEPLLPMKVKAYLDRLRISVSRKECWSCDCFQGLLTQFCLDCPEAVKVVEPLKVSKKEMHGCLGCDPCPPGSLFSEYLRKQSESL